MHRPQPRPRHVMATLAALAALALGPPALRGWAESAAPLTQEPRADTYDFEISLRQVPPPDHAARGEAKVTDRSTGKVLSAPQFVVGWGDDAVLESQDPETGARLRLEVAVAEDGRTATYEAELRHDGELVASRAATVPVEPAETGAP